MLGTKGKLLITILFCISVLCTGRARLILDGMVGASRADFREMLYLPRGRELKVLACGFDAPLADALFIKGMVYYAEALEKGGDKGLRESSRKYTYELFDVITDLSPRFYRAYQVGAIFLTGALDLAANENGARLLQKGVDYYDGAEKKGEVIAADPRWLLHLMAATTYDMNIQARRREAGDIKGAAAAREAASREFRLAAASPGAPAYTQMAASGYESVRKGKGDVGLSTAASLAVWQELYAQAQERGDADLMRDLKGRIESSERELTRIAELREWERLLTIAGGRYKEMKGRLPKDVEELLQAGGEQGVPKGLLENRDAFARLPDGTFRSLELAGMEASSKMDLVFDALVAYRRTHNAAPPDLEALVKGHFIEEVPELPLASLGQRFEYDEKSGGIRMSAAGE